MQGRPAAGFVLSLIAGVFLILNASILSMFHVLALFLSSMGYSFHLFPWFFLLFMAYGTLCGIMVFVGSYLIYKGRNVLGGILVIVFSILSLPIGGGFIMGFLLGVIGGALAIAGR